MGTVAIHERGMTRSDPRCSAWKNVVTKANWDATGVGPSCGTLHRVPQKEDSGFDGG